MNEFGEGAPSHLTTGEGNVIVPPGTPTDETVDALDPKDRVATNTELRSDRDRRHMRVAAFVFFALLSLSFFIVLWWTFVLMLLAPGPLAGVLGALGTHSTVFACLALVLIATVPVSLAFALIKISADNREEKVTPTGSDFLPPQLRTLKELADLAKSLHKGP